MFRYFIFTTDSSDYTDFYWAIPVRLHRLKESQYRLMEVCRRGLPNGGKQSVKFVKIIIIIRVICVICGLYHIQRMLSNHFMFRYFIFTTDSSDYTDFYWAIPVRLHRLKESQYRLMEVCRRGLPNGGKQSVKFVKIIIIIRVICVICGLYHIQRMLSNLQFCLGAFAQLPLEAQEDVTLKCEGPVADGARVGV